MKHFILTLLLITLTCVCGFFDSDPVTPTPDDKVYADETTEETVNENGE